MGSLRGQGSFVINLTTKDLVYAADWCGVKSGRDYNKFKEMGLTPVMATSVKAPMIAESPVSIECRVKEIKELGSHHMFISDVLTVNAENSLFDEKSGVFRLNEANLISYSHGKYFETGKFTGKFGFSVEKKKTKRRK
jgi:flavin reductase (DIM6/NTAB) family NADH-FMN oxidoreductase RutF